MKSRYYKLLMLALMLSLAGNIYYYFPQIKRNLVKTDDSPFGNILSANFYLKNSKAPAEELINYPESTRKAKSHNLQQFYSHLDWEHKQNNLDFNSLPNSAWHSIDRNGLEKENYLFFWQSIRKDIRAFFMQNIKPIKINLPVIHFRCSDSPFNRHEQYHLPKSESIRWIARQIKQRGFDQAIILNCNTHGNDNRNTCNKYLQFYSILFKQNGISLKSICSSILEDFSLMLNTPLLVALNQSSYSFMAGISKEPADFISCNMGRELNSKYILQSQADWVLDPNPPLLHREVKDYHDVESVIPLI